MQKKYKYQILLLIVIITAISLCFNVSANSSSSSTYGRFIPEYCSVAKILEGKRIGILGSADVEVNMLGEEWSVEVKSRKAYSLDKIFEQAVANAGGKKPLVWLHKHGRQFNNDIVALPAKVFLQLIKVDEEGLC